MNKICLPAVDSLSDFIDRLCIAIAQVHHLEELKRNEHAKGEEKDDKLISRWDHASREANEIRVELKKRINSLFEDIITTGAYQVFKLPRTFIPPKKPIGDTIDDRLYRLSGIIRQELAEQFGACMGELQSKKDFARLPDR